MSQLARKLIAVMFIDVVGYSRLMGVDDEGTLNRLRDIRTKLAPDLAEHGGRVVKTIGDAVLIEFASVVDAVRCAVRIQRALGALGGSEPASRRIAMRISVHLGDVIDAGDDIFGDGVNIAARLQEVAEAGGICISGTVREELREAEGLAFVDLGEKRFKNISRPIRVYRVVFEPGALAAEARARNRRAPRRALGLGLIAGTLLLAALIGTVLFDVRAPETPEAPLAPTEAPTPAQRISIVVLPFANLGGGEADEHVADTITEDVTTDLSRIKGALVIARNTAFTYKGRAVNMRDVGRELGVRYALEGSVRRSGERLVVTVQLIDTASGAHLWVDRIETELSERARIELAVTGRIAESLKQELIAAESRRALRERPGNPDAHDLVMQGWFVFNKGNSREINVEARGLFERALAIQPDAAMGLIGLARTHMNDVLNQFSNEPERQIGIAEAAVERALGLDRNLAVGYHVRGEIHRARRQHEEARANYQTAIDLDPNLASTHASLAIVKILLGQSEDAIEHVERAIRLSPRDRGLGIWTKWACDALLLLERDDEAMEWCRRSLATQPIWWTHLNMAALLALNDRLDEAKAARAELERQMPGYTIARHRAQRFSAHPVWLNQIERLYEGLRRAGVPER